MTVLVRPTATVLINNAETNWTEWHSEHSVEAGVGQCSITIPRPVPSNVFHGAKVVITAKNDTGDDPATCFVGQIRGPVEDQLSESDATVTVHADGPLWKLALPALADFSWVGPITPRKLLKQMLLFWGVPQNKSKVEQFVHPTTSVPILLGGIPWFDEGRIVLSEGESPLSLADRICRLFGYRIYDRPDGTIRVSRVNARPPDADYTMTEGDDILSITKDIDLHDIRTYWTAIGASGSDLVGQQVEIISRPRRGIRSKFIPNPPKYASAQVSDSLLVTQQAADAARIVAEKDHAGPTWRVSAEIHDAPSRVASLAPRSSFAVVASDVGLSGKKFWQTEIAQDFGASGYWATVQGWRGTGKHGKQRPPDDPADDPEDPWQSDGDVKDPPTADDLDPFGGGDTEDDALPPTYDLDPGEDGYVAIDDPDYDPDNPDTFLTDPPEQMPPGYVPCAPPASAPPRACQTVGVTEPSWEDDVPNGDTVEFDWTPPFDVDSVTVTFQIYGGGSGTVEIWQSALLVGSSPVAGEGPGWVALSVPVGGSVLGGIAAQAIFTATA